MGRHHAAEEEYEDDPNEPDESDMDDDHGDESAETVPCPHCGREIYEFAEVCPKCGAFMSREDRPPRSHARWVIITAAVLLIMMVYGAAKWGLW